MNKIGDIFIKKAKKVHCDKYDYSKVEYINNKTKVCIICPAHGGFWQTPNSHLKGHGCPKCASENVWKKRNKITIDDFIKRSEKIHKNKYDYSKVLFKKTEDKICIVCPIHGEFWQTVHSHLQGHGCPKCSIEQHVEKNKYNKNKFIEKARKVQGDKYDYSKVEYVNSETKVCIICPKHGEFWQQPSNHLQGHGCPKCGEDNRIIKNTYTTQDFIKKAIKVHGLKYDYSKVLYKRNDKKVCIICPVHGEFWQTPSCHLQGQGCNNCGIEENVKRHKSNNKDFIRKAQKIHNNKYDYSKVKYRGYKSSVCIICPVHGEFWQIPNYHLDGCGCPKCSQSHMEKETEEILLNKGIKYESQKHFEWLGKQSLDFYLPDYNIAIECQGEQHFKPVDFAGKGKEWAEILFKENIERDKNKLKLCEENQINLFYINYSENILEKINKIISVELK